MAEIRVLLADRHRVFAQIVAERLDDVADVSVAGICDTGAAVDDILGGAAADVLVIEPALDGDDGLSIVRSAIERAPGLRVIVLVVEHDPDQAVEALTNGVVGLVSKRAPFDELLAAIRCAARGEAWISPPLLGRVLDELLNRAAPAERHKDLAQLTERELEVLQCLVSGMNRVAIGRRLFLSTHTVRTHTRNVLSKLGAHSALEAVAIARAAGIAGWQPAVER